VASLDIAAMGISAPWILHSTEWLGTPTERWLDVQVDADQAYDSRLLGSELASGAVMRSRWILLKRWSPAWMAYRGLFRAGGVSGRWLAAYFRQQRPVAIHGHFGPSAARIVPLARALDRPLVASFYGMDASSTIYTGDPRWRERYTTLFHEAAAFVVEGPRMAQRLSDLGCPPAKIRIVRLPADAQSLVPIERRVGGRFTVVAAGRFTEKKGFDVAIEAFARAFRTRDDVELILIGGGELENRYRELIARYRIQDKVSIRGRSSFREYLQTLARAHVAVYPSRTAQNGDSEGGAPVTLIEGQWLGVPAIVSEHDDLPFVAAPEGTLIVPGHDIAGWAEAMLSLYDARPALNTMEQAARTFARTYHAPLENAEARDRIYNEVQQ